MAVENSPGQALAYSVTQGARAAKITRTSQGFKALEQGGVAN